jgi:hypothetical protein
MHPKNPSRDSKSKDDKSLDHTASSEAVHQDSVTRGNNANVDIQEYGNLSRRGVVGGSSVVSSTLGTSHPELQKYSLQLKLMGQRTREYLQRL